MKLNSGQEVEKVDNKCLRVEWNLLTLLSRPKKRRRLEKEFLLQQLIFYTNKVKRKIHWWPLDELPDKKVFYFARIKRRETVIVKGFLLLLCWSNFRCFTKQTGTSFFEKVIERERDWTLNKLHLHLGAFNLSITQCNQSKWILDNKANWKTSPPSTCSQ